MSSQTSPSSSGRSSPAPEIDLTPIIFASTDRAGYPAKAFKNQPWKRMNLAPLTGDLTPFGPESTSWTKVEIACSTTYDNGHGAMGGH